MIGTFYLRFLWYFSPYDICSGSEVCSSPWTKVSFQFAWLILCVIMPCTDSRVYHMHPSIAVIVLSILTKFSCSDFVSIYHRIILWNIVIKKYRPIVCVKFQLSTLSVSLTIIMLVTLYRRASLLSSFSIPSILWKMPAGGLLFAVVCAAPLSKEVSAVFHPSSLTLWLNTNPPGGLQAMNRFIEEKLKRRWRRWVETCIRGQHWRLFRRGICIRGTSGGWKRPKFPDAWRMLPTDFEASRRYRVGNYARLLCHHGRQDRSTKYDTVLLTCAERSLEGELLSVPTVRATFEASALSLIVYETGHSSVGRMRNVLNLKETMSFMVRLYKNRFNEYS